MLPEQTCLVVRLLGHELERSFGPGQIDHMKATGPGLPIIFEGWASGGHCVGEAVHVRPVLLVELRIVIRRGGSWRAAAVDEEVHDERQYGRLRKRVG